MNIAGQQSETDKSKLLDYTEFADEQAGFSADVKCSTKLLANLEKAGVADLSWAVLFILDSYKELLVLMGHRKRGDNGESVVFTVSLEGVPFKVVCTLELNRDNDYWPTLVIRQCDNNTNDFLRAADKLPSALLLRVFFSLLGKRRI